MTTEGDAGQEQEQPDLSEFHELTDSVELRRIIGELQLKLRRARANTADLVDAVFEGAKAAAVILGNPPPVPEAKKDTRRKAAEVALLHLSDWQLGKRTDSYNTEVAKGRVAQVTDKVLQMAKIERSDHPVREIHVMLGGDMIEGDNIFQLQAFEIDSTMFEQMMAASGCLEEMMRALLSEFEQVHIWIEEGNHGRLGKKGEHPREDNADLMVYQLLKERMKGHIEDGRMVWHDRQGFYQHIEIGNYKAILVHGDEVRSFGGQTPAFGIAKKVNAWATGVIPNFTDCYMGHWHSPHVIPLAHGQGRVFVNPSIESDSIYAQEFVGANGKPGQRLHFIDPKDGIVTTERILWVD